MSISILDQINDKTRCAFCGMAGQLTTTCDPCPCCCNCDCIIEAVKQVDHKCYHCGTDMTGLYAGTVESFDDIQYIVCASCAGDVDVEAAVDDLRKSMSSW